MSDPGSMRSTTWMGIDSPLLNNNINTVDTTCSIETYINVFIKNAQKKFCFIKNGSVKWRGPQDTTTQVPSFTQGKCLTIWLMLHKKFNSELVPRRGSRHYINIRENIPGRGPRGFVRAVSLIVIILCCVLGGLLLNVFFFF